VGSRNLERQQSHDPLSQDDYARAGPHPRVDEVGNDGRRGLQTARGEIRYSRGYRNEVLCRQIDDIAKGAPGFPAESERGFASTLLAPTARCASTARDYRRAYDALPHHCRIRVTDLNDARNKLVTQRKWLAMLWVGDFFHYDRRVAVTGLRAEDATASPAGFQCAKRELLEDPSTVGIERPPATDFR
jgi:hypothetical protein